MLLSVLLQAAAAGVGVSKLGAALGAGLAVIGAGMGIGKIGSYYLIVVCCSGCSFHSAWFLWYWPNTAFPSLRKWWKSVGPT